MRTRVNGCGQFIYVYPCAICACFGKSLSSYPSTLIIAQKQEGRESKSLQRR
jgi:hypothetical protein